MENLANRNRVQDTEKLSLEAIGKDQLEQQNVTTTVKLRLQQVIGESQHAFRLAA